MLEDFMLEAEARLLILIFLLRDPRRRKPQNHFIPVQAFLLQRLNAFARDPR